MSELDEIDRIIAEVAKKHRILLKPTDPVFLFVTAARSVLEWSFARLDQRMLDRLAAFDQSIRAVSIRAGRVLAEVVKGYAPPASPNPEEKRPDPFETVAIHIPVFSAGVLLGAVATLFLLDA